MDWPEAMNINDSGNAGPRIRQACASLQRSHMAGKAEDELYKMAWYGSAWHVARLQKRVCLRTTGEEGATVSVLK